MSERTLPGLFEESVGAYPANVLIWEKSGPRYQPTTFAAMRPLVHRFAAGLMSLGLRKGRPGGPDLRGPEGLAHERARASSPSAPSTCPSRSGSRSSATSSSGWPTPAAAWPSCRKSQLPKIRQVRLDLPDLARIVVLDGPDTLGPRRNRRPPRSCVSARSS